MQRGVLAGLAIMVLAVFAALFALMAGVLSLANASANPERIAARRVLFIGNSFTDINGGIDAHLAGLAPGTTASRIAPGGYTLDSHWNNAGTLQAIRGGRWDVVVLQEQSQTPVLNAPAFFDAAGKLDAEIRRAGAQTVLFMTWTRPDSAQAGVTTANLSERYTALGQQLGAPVAPAGLAFARALQERPRLELYLSDGHPTLRGTYLAACVIYGTIYHASPLDNAYGAGLSADERAYLQRIAAQTLGY